MAVVSSTNSFKGEALDRQLRSLGQERRDGETDWEFRKRIFPDIFQHDRRWAYEILVGKSWQNFDPLLEALFQQLSIGKEPSREELIKFARQWKADPQDLSL